MATYQGGQAFTTSFVADVDLTAAQWKIVKPASTAGNVASANSGCSVMPLGVLVNDPSAGQEAAVAVIGFVKAKARVTSCYLANGTLLKAASDALFEPVGTTDQPILARWFGARNTTADASILGEVLLFGLAGASGAGGLQGGAG